MSESSPQTIQLRQLVERWQAGDRTAANDLFRIMGTRMERLARRMLRQYPRVRNWAETSDIVQGATWRLLQSLQTVQPNTMRDFFSLTAVQIRRELIDLARRCRNKLVPSAPEEANETAAPEPLAEDVELWSRFHLAVESLACEDREVFSLVFYHGWTQQQIADLFDVHQRTIRRRWQTACLHLTQHLGGHLPVL